MSRSLETGSTPIRASSCERRPSMGDTHERAVAHAGGRSPKSYVNPICLGALMLHLVRDVWGARSSCLHCAFNLAR